MTEPLYQPVLTPEQAAQLKALLAEIEAARGVEPDEVPT